MTMDDPWGSAGVWADDNNNNNNNNNNDEASHKPGAGPELKATTPAQLLPETPIPTPKVRLNSPWDDDADDNFGSWNIGAEVGKGEAVESNLGAIEEDPWAAKGEFYNPKTSAGGDGILSTWKDDPNLSGQKISNQLLPGENIIRQSSPDPWAAQLVADDRNEDRLEQKQVRTQGDPPRVESEQQINYNVGSRGTMDAPGMKIPQMSETGTEGQSEMQEDSENRNLSHVLVGQDMSKPGRVDSPSNLSCEEPQSEHQIEVIDPDAVPFTQSIENEAQHVSDRSLQSSGGDTDMLEDPVSTLENPEIESSRSSSAPSDHSHHDEQALPDSPRTSLDEEQGRSQPLRKVSKVHELVQHFDSIIAQQLPGQDTITRTTPDPVDHQSDEVDREPEDDMDDFGDFGDYEEGISDEEPSPSSEFNGLQESTGDDVVVSASRKDHGPVTFNIDINSIESLCLGAAAATKETVFVPDTIIHDTFQSVEQRKTWYRVSRYGTMRKYNSGDDDNYKRVKWNTSDVRDETLKVVARWMEEDRISGRVVLGGGSKGSSLFGWNDSKQGPVPINSALADKHKAKKSQVSINTASEVPREWPQISSRRTSIHEQKRRRSSSKGLQQFKELKSMDSQSEETLVADFGWNMPPKDPRGTKAQSLVSHVPISNPNLISEAQPMSSEVIPDRSAPESDKTSSPVKGAKERTNSSTRNTTPVSVSKPSTQPSTTRPMILAPSSDAMRAQPDIASRKEKNVIDGDDGWGEMISSPTLAPMAAMATFPPQRGLRHKKSISLNESSSSTSFGLITESQIPRPQSSQANEAAMDFSTISPTIQTSRMQAQFVKVFDSSPQTTSLTTDQKSDRAIAASTGDNQDPWASADFSFFDKGPPVATASTSASKSANQPHMPLAKRASRATTATPVHAASNQKTVSSKTKGEFEQERVVRSIVDALPDLSYMLR
ncbi:hypothetical protein PVAG01_04883 [Phlyctema vagabunda]|uniref:Uncharacterized protein n=1 Tax=Phlyctema vagabunda TaxID=108571 RepID=A0ABR4PIH4_9HELO